MATTFNTKSRILIAADSAANASLVKKLLEDEFGTIAISTNPERIVEEYQEAQPDVLVLAFNGWTSRSAIALVYTASAARSSNVPSAS